MKNKLYLSFMLPLQVLTLTGCANSPDKLNYQDSPIQQSERKTTDIKTNDELKMLAAKAGNNCNIDYDSKKQQYIIGYGSLMQDDSRKRSSPTADSAYPVEVYGFRRGWFAKGGSEGFDTTYLGAVPDRDSKFNAVIFKIHAEDIPTIDKREYFYCRLLVQPNKFKLLAPQTPVPSGQVWIYVNKPESIATANAKYPVVESYVDIFVTGCTEQEKRYGIINFAKDCINSTKHWSTAWVNDRVYPRRPFIYQPMAGQIDKLLSELLPDYFLHIQIE